MADQMNTRTLHQLMHRLTEGNLLTICVYISDELPHCKDLEYEGLRGYGVLEKSISLIDYCRKHRVLTHLISNVHYIRSDVLNTSYDDWQDWAADEDTSNPEQARQERRAREEREKAAREQAEREASERIRKEQAEREARQQTAHQISDLLNQLTSAETSGNWDKVIEMGEKILRLDSSNQTAKSKTAQAYRERGLSYAGEASDDQAIADYFDFDWDKEGLPDYLKEFVLSEREASHDQAIADYNRAIQLDPNNASYYRERGISYHNKGSYDQAIADKSKAIQLNPNIAQYYYSRGLSYKAKGNTADAHQDFQRATDLGHAGAKTELAKL